ncbi:CoA-transferase subunit beta [Microbulbifer magnicolonia]|uniref:CoA-transferase subunit beta n=1 Tax=Microbulbifer magnicolonia TaxID=3109744 RepID=UPI002B414279|nr:CoA-transferase [Microbulbifer sp. GG15]
MSQPIENNSQYTQDEMMTVTAARQLADGAVCFVGIGLPSAACNLARELHAPNLVLIYESGTVGTKPRVLPLSIGDGELAETAEVVIPLPEIFTHYLQAGRVDIGFLGAAQIDRFGNLNSTAIGPYDNPKVRLPGAGGAPEIATHAKSVLVIMRMSPKSFVSELAFRTSSGFLGGNGERAARGYPGRGPQAVITDFGVLRPHPETDELVLTDIYPGVDAADAIAACGWPLQVADELQLLAPPTATELAQLRALNERTRVAHAMPVKIPLVPKSFNAV